jgi:dCMP deaminase
MERPSVDEIMMLSALNFARRSTCCRVKAGAVIALDNHIISTGYNGNAPGHEHCESRFKNIWYKERTKLWEKGIKGEFEDWIKTDDFKDLHRGWAIKHEFHGEMNSIIWAARRGISVYGGTIYTTYSPCLFCTKAIIHAGLKRVVYNKLYDRPEGHDSIEILKENDIDVYKIEVKMEEQQCY